MDGLFLAARTCPALTAVQLPVPEMARTIVERHSVAPPPKRMAR